MGRTPAGEVEVLVTESFARERVRHELRMRHLSVSRVERVAPAMVRVTVAGEALEGFISLGPADHVKVFFPDPGTGETALPVFTDAGVQPPETGTVIARDYTPLAFNDAAAAGEGAVPTLDLDFVIHGDDGPASAWASRVEVGDTLTIAGPRGSHLPPTGASAAVVFADETALPAARRWLEHFGDTVPVTGLFSVADPQTSTYFDVAEDVAKHHELRWFSGDGRESEALQALRDLDIDEATFVFLAGEATSLIPMRRYLRRELGLPASQVDVSGYWKRGEENLDHHAPIDPSDPD